MIPYSYRTDDVDMNKNGVIGLDEFKKWHSMFIDRIIFKYYDSNGDGYVDKKVNFNSLSV